jgi:hypothetical protein
MPTMAFADPGPSRARLPRVEIVPLPIRRLCHKGHHAFFWTMFFIVIIRSHGLVQLLAMPF